MNTKLLLLIAAGCGASLASAQPRIGISLRIGAPPPIIVREEPPRTVVVVQAPPRPVEPNHVWVPSHHRREEGRWVRVEGGWMVPPQADAVWVEGRWDRQSNSWTEEHWEINRPGSYDSQPGSPPPYSSGRSPWERSDHDSNRGSYGEFYVGSAPPPLRQERMSSRPSRQHVWIAGYWTARNRRHEWVAGHWEVPPRERSAWVAPRWEQENHTYLFVRGYWGDPTPALPAPPAPPSPRRWFER